MTVRANALVLVLAAGSACSMALAGNPADWPNPVQSGLRFGGKVGSLGGPDLLQDIYNNGNTTATTGYFSSANTSKVLDDIYFNRGPGAGPGPGTAGVARLMTSATVGFASTATVNPSATVDVFFQWFNAFNPAAAAGVAVNSIPVGNVRVTLQPPAGGWAANTVYTTDLDLTALPGGGITTAGEFGGAELALFADSGTTPSADFNVAFYGEGVSVGNSSQTFWSDANSNGIYAGDEGFIFTGPERPRAAIVLSLSSDVTSGSCCLPDGTCILAGSASCARVGGVYGGDGSECGTAVCAQPGACVLAASACILTNAAQCTALGGIYRGDGTNCALGVCRSGTAPVVLWNNGPLATGTTIGASTAPAGTQYSEAAGTTACSSPTAGYSGGVVGATLFRLADNFVVPPGETWTVQSLETYAYQTGSTTTTSPISGVNVVIWSGEPYEPTSTIVAGDEFTNLMTSSTFASIYRAFNNTPGTTRPVFKNIATFSTPVVLQSGTYWVDWQTTVTNGLAHFAPPVTTKAYRGTAGRDGLQRVPAGAGDSWTHIDEVGSTVGCGEGFVGVDHPFILRGSTQGVASPFCSTASCYVNCDNSTNSPCLNINDYVCFNSAYAAGSAYANCDASTLPPVLNVNDFVCFNTKYAAGCTQPCAPHP